MKRSEMIKRMTEHWLGLFPDENIEDKQLQEATYKNMSNLLDFLEKNDIQPPPRFTNLIDGVIYEWEKE